MFIPTKQYHKTQGFLTLETSGNLRKWYSINEKWKSTTIIYFSLKKNNNKTAKNHNLRVTLRTNDTLNPYRVIIIIATPPKKLKQFYHKPNLKRIFFGFEKYQSRKFKTSFSQIFFFCYKRCLIKNYIPRERALFPANATCRTGAGEMSNMYIF